MADYEEGVNVPVPIERTAKGEMFTQVEIAKQNPRDVVKFQKSLEALVCSSEEVAKSCFYTLMRKDKDGNDVTIQGPSIHFMRLAAPLYKNLRWAGRQAGEEEGSVVTQGVAFDTENNLFVSIEVRRNITKRNGGRYSPDMVNTTIMAGMSIALRNAMLNVISKPFWEPAYLAAKKKAVGTAKGIGTRRQSCIAEFGKMGVKVEELLAYIKKEKIDQIDLAALDVLLGTFNAIKDGQQDVDETFGRTKPGMDMPQSNAEAGVTPTPGGPLEAALGKPTESPAAPSENGAETARKGGPTTSPPAGDVSPSKPLPIPQDRKTLLERINKALASYPSAEVTKVWQNHIGKADPNVAQIGRLQGMFIALGLNKG